MVARQKPPDELSLTQAASYLRLSRQTIWDAIQRGRIKARKVGQAIVISRKALDHYKSTRKRTGRPPKKTKKSP